MSIRAQSDGYRCKIWSEVNPCWLRQNTALHKFVLGDYQERSLEMIYFDVLLCRKSTFCFLAIVPALPSRIQCVSINGVLHSCHACPYVRLYACLYVRKTNLCRPQEGLTNDVRPPPPTPSVLQCDRRRSPHVLRPCHVVSQARRVWGTGLICALGRQGGGKGGSDPGNCSVRNLFYGVALVAHHPLLCSSCTNPCHATLSGFLGQLQTLLMVCLLHADCVSSACLIASKSRDCRMGVCVFDAGLQCRTSAKVYTARQRR